MEPIPALDLARETDQPVLRQVQFDGRRHAISIEPVYWSVLEEASQTAEIRLNQLVKLIATAPNGPDNLAARLRLYCIRRQSRRLQDFENRPRTINLPQIIEACPVPCFAVSRRLTIVWHNQVLQKWLGLSSADLTGMPLARHFRLKLFSSQTNAWHDFSMSRSSQPTGVETGTLTCSFPGRMLVRPASVCPVAPTSKSLICLVYIRT